MSHVIIFRETLLPPSETFILEQAAALSRYTPVLAGMRRLRHSLESPFKEILLSEQMDEKADRAVALYRYLGLGRKFLRKLRAEDPVVMHAHFATDAVQALPIAKALRIPLFVSLHGYDVTTTDQHFRKSRQGRHYLRHRSRLFAQADWFLCVSSSILQAALKAGFPEEKLLIHYTGIDCARFAPSTEPRDSKLILFVGRLVEKKGCEVLLRAMPAVQQRDPQAHVEIIGDGPLRPSLEALAKQLGVHANFRGVQSSEEVRSSMSRARVLCNPSVKAANGDSEGFGMVFAEAQAVGTPVVSSRHAAIPEVVDNGVTGTLCPEHDSAAIASALSSYLEDDELWMRTSYQATRWVRRSFDIATRTRRLEDLFDAALEKRPAPASKAKWRDLAPLSASLRNG